MQVESVLNPYLKLSGSLNIQEGISKDQDEIEEPLGHIPPLFGSAQMSYTRNKFSAQLNWRFNGWKRIENYGGSVDNPDLTTIDGAPSWHLLGLNVQYKLSKSATLGIGLDNIMDIHYRPFASGLSAPGRHIIASLRYDLGDM